MKLTTTGIKAVDRTIELEKLNLLHGKNGAGKSTLVQALQFLALGHVPSLGKRYVDTAALMLGTTMEVELCLEDGRTMRRILAKTDKGSFTQDAAVSWLKNAKPQEIGQEITHQFGNEELDVAEVLDIRQLLNAAPNQRTARIEQLLESTKRPAAQIAASVARLIVMRLIPNLKEANMPKDVKDAMPMVEERHRPHLYKNAKLIHAKIVESGIAGALAWANEEKKAAATGLTRQEAAAHQHRLRAVEVPEPDEREIKKLEEERDAIQQTLGALLEQGRQYAERAASRREASEAATKAKRNLDQIAEELALLEKNSKGKIEEFTKRSEKALKQMESLKAPVAPSDDDLVVLQKEIDEIRSRIDDIEIPEIPETHEENFKVRGLQGDLKRAKASPWTEVLAIAQELKKDKTGKAFGLRLEKLARAQQERDVETIEAELKAAEEALNEATAAAEQVRAKRTALEEKSTELRALREAKETELQRKRSEQNTAHIKALADFDAEKRKILTERQACESNLADLRSKLERLQREHRAAENAHTAAYSRLRGVGDLPAAPESTDAQAERLEKVKASLQTLIDARAVHSEIQKSLAAIEEAKAERDVFGAIEWALQRQREIELNEAGGPLIANMTGFLKAAGREEKPFVRSNGIGWTNADGFEVMVQVLSGGEWALFSAALTSSVMLCRQAPVRVLIVEAGETDQTTLQQLLKGIAAIADGLTAAFVLTPFPPQKPGKPWNVVNIVNEPVAA